MPDNEYGTYILLLKNPLARELSVGKFGTNHFRPGWYLYVGSAFGPGGINARVTRHCRTDKKVHWHVDHLTNVLGVATCWYHAGPDRLECQWNRQLEMLHNGYPQPGFGSSDCQCESHLHYFAKKPSRALLSRLLNLQLNTRGN